MAILTKYDIMPELCQLAELYTGEQLIIEIRKKYPAITSIEVTSDNYYPFIIKNVVAHQYQYNVALLKVDDDTKRVFQQSLEKFTKLHSTNGSWVFKYPTMWSTGPKKHDIIHFSHRQPDRADCYCQHQYMILEKALTHTQHCVNAMKTKQVGDYICIYNDNIEPVMGYVLLQIEKIDGDLLDLISEDGYKKRLRFVDLDYTIQ